MSLGISAGWGSQPDGNWNVQVYSAAHMRFLRAIAVSPEISNTMYEGEIAKQGDKVRIAKQPSLSVTTLTIGQDLTYQDYDDDEVQLDIDQGLAVMFRTDDIQKHFVKVDVESMLTDSANYNLSNAYDVNILTYAVGNASTSTSTGTDGSPVTVGYGGSNTFLPLDYINKCNTILTQNNVPDDGKRFIVANPLFWEQVFRSDSVIIDAALTGDSESVIRARKLALQRELHGFRCFSSNNIPVSASSRYTVLYGHTDGLATATAMTKAETLRDQRRFGDLYRSALVFGRKIVRPESIFCGHISTLGDL